MGLLAIDMGKFFVNKAHYESLALETTADSEEELAQTQAELESGNVGATNQGTNTILYVAIGVVVLGILTFIVLKKKKII
jgi:LPXTG-motif cell wall-anchored protein